MRGRDRIAQGVAIVTLVICTGSIAVLVSLLADRHDHPLLALGSVEVVGLVACPGIHERFLFMPSRRSMRASGLA